ncbi:putative multidrug-efflux transporter [bacterium HR17]|uniref:Putative multidrug-efflux transporter n=1 Tax=Candidatus Fervidibacter japonicus TaxID=2035412 RepID=A0A2H5X9J6_9BACT|nr:putative multidrug-efflux transporter [bacterium HR17]
MTLPRRRVIFCPSVTTEMDDERRLPAPLRPLAFRNYRLFFFGQLISLMGTWMQSVAQQWLVYRLTGSPALLGLVGFLGQIPVFLFAPIGGVIADRFPKRKVVIVTQTLFMVLAFLFALLTLTRHIRVWHIPLLAFLFGLVNAADVPARQAFVPEMVPRSVLLNAIALNSAMFNIARIIGPAVAGVTVAAVGEGWCFFANAVSYIAVIAGLLLMDVPDAATPSANASPLAHLLEGLRFVAQTRPICAILLVLGVVSLTGMPYVVLMPIFADRILHAGAKGLGVLMTASGIGALCGALLLAMREGLRGLGVRVAFGAIGFGTSLIAFSLSRSFWLSVLLMVPAGFCMITQMASANTLVQTLAPDELRGRVMSVYAMMFMGMAPFGSLMAGTLATWLGVPMTVALGGALCIVAGALFAHRLPLLRTEARKLLAASR